MAKLSLGQKAERVLQLLMGFGNARIASAMATRGLTQEDIDEGWDLLKATSRVRASRQPDLSASPTIVAKVDAWENLWFPVVDATLERRFPQIHKTVFNNLSQTEGPPVLLSVSLLLDRLAELEKASDKDSKDARALLKVRGVTKAVLDEAKAYLAEAEVPAEPTVTPQEEVDAAVEQAEAQLWAYYLEWSKIARVAVKDGRLLAQLGFGAASRKRKKGDEDEDEDGDGSSGPTGSN